MSNYLVVVTDDRFGGYDEEREVLKGVNAELKIYNCRSDSDAVAAVKDADAVLVNLQPLHSDIIGSMKRCRVISRYGVGYDNVDVDAATKAGIWVARVPDYSYEDVSDHALALLLGCVRKIAYKDRRVREGGWDLKQEQPVHRIKSRVLGLIGYGAIARALRRKVSGLGLSRVLAHDPYLEPETIRKNGGIPVDFKTLLQESDYISVHVPLTDETKGIISTGEIENMKEGVILINTSRGPVLDEKAVVAALKKGRINSAGLDVFETEPLPADHPLKSLDNVILSDHTGYYSEESLKELKTKAALNIVEVLKGRKPVYPVNNVL